MSWPYQSGIDRISGAGLDHAEHFEHQLAKATHLRPAELVDAGRRLAEHTSFGRAATSYDIDGLGLSFRLPPTSGRKGDVRVMRGKAVEELSPRAEDDRRPQDDLRRAYASNTALFAPALRCAIRGYAAPGCRRRSRRYGPFAEIPASDAKRACGAAPSVLDSAEVVLAPLSNVPTQLTHRVGTPPTACATLSS